ncbi:MAG: ZIP family metal transporter [Mycoplasma sp.]|nr:ZIP family metal transporter [Mycoplasma sp.]
MNKYIIALLLSGIVMVVPFFLGIILPFIKPTIKKKSYIYLYSLSSGFILVLGLFGLIAHPLMHYLENSKVNETQKNLKAIGIAIGASTLGMGAAFITRHFLHNDKKEIHSNHQNHKHEDYIFNIKELENGKTKITVIVLLGLHKLPAGISLGIFASSKDGIYFATIISLIIHMIPETLTIYYRQIEIGIKKWKALINSTIIQAILIPFIFIGVSIVSVGEWVKPFVLTSAGSLLVFTAIVELIPEFIDHDFTHNKWHKTILLFIIGFILSLSIMIIHKH